MQTQNEPQTAPEAPDTPQASEVSAAEVESFADFGSFLLAKGEAYWTAFLRMTPRLILAVVVLVVVALLARLASAGAKALAKRAHVRPAIVDLIGVLTRTFIWLVGGFLALSIVFPSVNAGSVLAGLGVGGVVIGIAFKDVFENFLAGVMILLRRSMRIGDYIDCQDVEGRIEHISLRDTQLRRVDGELVIVPNIYLFTNPVRVWTDPDYRRFDLVVGVGYDEDVDEARRVIQQAMESVGLPDSGKKPQVFASGFGASSIDFNVRWWAEPEPIDMHTSRDEVVSAIKRALDEAGIEIPFPYRTLTFKEPLRLDRDEQRGAAA